MTREDATISVGNIPINEGDDCYTIAEYQEAKAMAIKALKQVEVLDKIRAEIKSLQNANPSYWHSGDMVDREEVLEIIDKYREG